MLKLRRESLGQEVHLPSYGHGLVGDAFQVKDHAHGRKDEAQILGHGLRSGNDAGALFVKLKFHLVDDVIAADYLFRDIDVTEQHGGAGLAVCHLHKAAHGKQLGPQSTKYGRSVHLILHDQPLFGAWLRHAACSAARSGFVRRLWRTKPPLSLFVKIVHQSCSSGPSAPRRTARN